MPPRSSLPAIPPDLPVPARVRLLAGAVGAAVVVDACCDLLAGAARTEHLDALPYLTRSTWEAGSAVLDAGSWGEHWVRHWGGRGLLHVWLDEAGPAVVAGLRDAHWRPVETCLKVVARHDVAGAGDPVAALVGHGVPRVRVQVARALAVVGDTDHVAAVALLGDDPEAVVRRAAERALEAMAARLDLPAGEPGELSRRPGPAPRR